jgi:hypothetical protein
MRETFTGLRAIRETIQEGPTVEERAAILLEHEIADFAAALAGERRSRHWQKWNTELENKRLQLRDMKRRLAGRRPSMANWNDPLPE